MSSRGCPAERGGARGAWKVWLLAVRPKTLPAAAAPVVLGTACAAAVGGFRLGPALAALVGALALQVTANLINDVADFQRGIDREDRLGPVRVTQAGLLTAAQVQRGAVVAVAVATAAGAYLWWVTGWPVVVIGSAAIVAAVAYTAGPFPLAHHGLGEPFVLVFFGLVAVAGTAWVQALAVPPSAWWGGVSCGAFATAILVINNTRDWAGDRRAGRRTVPARLGRGAGVVELGFFFLLGHAATATAVIVEAYPPLAASALATAIPAWLLWRTVACREDGPTLNRALATTGRLLLAHSALVALGLVSG